MRHLKLEMIRLKFLVYDFGTPLLVAIIPIVVIGVTVSPERFEKIALSGAGLLLGFIYFIQKQKLEETRLFKDLFADFNHKYQDMRERLEALPSKPTGAPSDEDRSVIVNYLNLCSEEYLFYQRGYIHPLAWRTWHRGMQDRLRDPAVLSIAIEELQKDFYYGLEQVVKLPTPGLVTEETC